MWWDRHGMVDVMGIRGEGRARGGEIKRKTCKSMI